MDVFGSYASFYDAIYKEKNYKAECDYIESLLAAYSKHEVRSILDLGCGTGSHAIVLAERGYRVTGVDRAAEMLQIAREKSQKKNIDVNFIKGDIRNLDVIGEYDAVIAMFAVMSYQASNDAIEGSIQGARAHLRKGGLFIFDCWFGPAVLNHRPQHRYKVMGDSRRKVIRFATPTLDITAHTVKVDYDVLNIEGSKIISEVKESHVMRFLFPQEIAYFLSRNGFELKALLPFMKLDQQVSEEHWNITAVAEAV